MAKTCLTPGERAWLRFRQHRRGYWSLWLFAVIFCLSLVAELLSNDRPIVARYDGRTYVPLFHDYPETTFGGDFQTKTDYLDPFIQAQLSTGDNWAIWPLNRYRFDTLNYFAPSPNPAAPSAVNRLGTDDRGRDVLARLIYGLRISVLFGLALTAIGMLWRQVFKCQAPLHRQGTPWNKRACATCAMHVKGRMDGIFDPSDPMSGCRHWCAAGPELVPLDEEAVRVGNDILRMLGGDKTEHHWVRRGERWLKPSSLRTQDIWDSCCEKHCFPREMGSPRVRLVEGIGIHRCVINIPGNPLADEDGDGGVVSNARQLTAVLVRKK